MVHEITLKRLKLLLLSCSVKHASLGISDVTKSSKKNQENRGANSLKNAKNQYQNMAFGKLANYF